MGEVQSLSVPLTSGTKKSSDIIQADTEESWLFNLMALHRRSKSMKQVLVYSDSLTWGIIPNTRKRLEFKARWPGVLENTLIENGIPTRVIEDCLNGRRTVWNDPFKTGRNGLEGLAQRIEIHSPLDLAILMLGTNDFQSMHPHTSWHSAQGIRTLIIEIRGAPIEAGMPIPEILVISPPEIQTPKGPMAQKFAGAEVKCKGIATEYRKITEELNCHFFDAGAVTTTSKIDGIHLDQDQHHVLGVATGKVVSGILGGTN